jgi:hypothetical protein
MTRVRRRAAIATAIIGMWACVSAIPASACSCAVRDLADQVSTASTVFVGTVTSTDETTATFDVFRVYKGSATRSIPIRNDGVGSTCAIPFTEGRTYVIFAALQSGTLSTDLCSGTTDDLTLADRLSVDASPALSPHAGPPVIRVIVVSRRTTPIVAAGMLAALVAAALLLAIRGLDRPRPFA